MTVSSCFRGLEVEVLGTHELRVVEQVHWYDAVVVAREPADERERPAACAVGPRDVGALGEHAPRTRLVLGLGELAARLLVTRQPLVDPLHVGLVGAAGLVGRGPQLLDLGDLRVKAGQPDRHAAALDAHHVGVDDAGHAPPLRVLRATVLRREPLRHLDAEQPREDVDGVAFPRR